MPEVLSDDKAIIGKVYVIWILTFAQFLYGLQALHGCPCMAQKL